MARPRTLRLVLLPLFLLTPIAAVAQDEIPPPRPADEWTVFAIDGSGQLRGIGDDLRQAVADSRQVMNVETFAWSHGAGRIIADLHDHDYQKLKGQELAEAVLAARLLAPAGKVFLVCHSAGAAVVLAAALQLPEGAVERVVFLAPALAPSADIRPVLRCARRGADCFYSGYDMIGSMVLPFMGNADGQFQASAGSVGFTPVRTGDSDDPLYAQLRQRPWDWEMTKTGNFGGHFGCTRGSFLRDYVVPLLKAGE